MSRPNIFEIDNNSQDKRTGKTTKYAALTGMNTQKQMITNRCGMKIALNNKQWTLDMVMSSKYQKGWNENNWEEEQQQNDFFFLLFKIDAISVQCLKVFWSVSSIFFKISGIVRYKTNRFK